MDRRAFLKAAGISPLAAVSSIGPLKGDEVFVIECPDVLDMKTIGIIREQWDRFMRENTGKTYPVLVLDGGLKLKVARR